MESEFLSQSIGFLALGTVLVLLGRELIKKRWSWTGLVVALGCGFVAAIHSFAMSRSVLDSHFEGYHFGLLVMDPGWSTTIVSIIIYSTSITAMMLAVRNRRGRALWIVVAVCLFALISLGGEIVAAIFVNPAQLRIELGDTVTIPPLLGGPLLIAFVIIPFATGIPWALLREVEAGDSIAGSILRRYALTLGTLILAFVLLAVLIVNSQYHALQEASIASARQDAVALSLTLGVLLAASVAAFWMFRRNFVVPAIALLEQVNGSGQGDGIVSVNTLWQPWAEAINQRRAETARHIASLEEQSKLTNTIFESASDIIIVCDAERRVINMNDATETVSGWSRSDAIGKRSEDVFFKPSARAAAVATWESSVKKLADTPSVRLGEFELQHREGHAYNVDFTIVAASINGEPMVLAYGHDLTERKQAEANLAKSYEAVHQSEKLAALGQLLAGVAHELNNPLTVVVGRSAILEEKLAGTPHAKSISSLRESADLCSRIVKTFLAMARQSGPRRASIQINDLIGGALDMTAYGLRTAGITVVQDLDPDLPETSADEDQLTQVLINLIINAQHALERSAGERRITLQTRLAMNGGAIVIEVIDSGCGIDAKIAPRIFEPFFTTKGVGEGTGMGLAMSKGIIEEHQGSLTAHATQGGGATFRAILPIDRPASRTPTPAGEPKLQPSGKARVLIVDDEPHIRSLLADCLAPLGFTCDQSSNGEEALKRIAAQPFDLIFCDIRMPGIDGVAMYQHLSEADPLHAARMIFISGDVFNRKLEKLAPIAGCPIIEKPFNPSQARELAIARLHMLDSAREPI